MIKKTMTYEDLDGNDVTEDFYFAMNKREAMRLKMIDAGVNGLGERFREIVKTQDPRLILDTFEELITSSYGRRSEDNKSFIKRSEWTEAFIGSDAYTQLFEKLVTDAEFALEFIKGVLPKDLAGNVSDLELPPEMKGVKEASITPAKKPSEMTREELVAALQNKTAANA